MTNPTNQDRQPRRCEPVTSRHVSDVWKRLDQDQQDDVRARAFAADQTTFEYMTARFEVCKAALFGPRRSGIEEQSQGEPTRLSPLDSSDNVARAERVEGQSPGAMSRVASDPFNERRKGGER